MEKYSSKYNYMQTNIDVRELLIRMLSQWKAALVLAILAAIVISGWKYSKSIAAYKNQMQASEDTAVQASSAEDIQKIYENLGEDRLLVELVLSQEGLFEKENDYYQNSILMNTDFGHARTMNVQYALAFNADNSNDSDLTKAYEKYVKSESFTEGLASVLGRSEDLTYISELVFCDKIFDKEVFDTTVLDVNVILPEGADADVVSNYVMKQIESYRAEAQKKCGDHSLTHLRSEIKEGVFIELVEKQNAVVSNLHNLQTAIRTNKTAMTEAQKTAYNSIESANASSKAVEVAHTEPVKPGISKKYAVFGFILGIIMYVLCAFCLMVSKGKVRSINEAELYSGQRLLGNLYYSRQYFGLNKLLHSNVINHILHRKPDDPDVKLDRISDLITKVFAKSDIEELALANIDPGNKQGIEYAEKLREKLADNGLKVRLNNINAETAEADFLGMDNAVIIIHGDETSEKELLRFTDICDSFSINRSGVVYMQSL